MHTKTRVRARLLLSLCYSYLQKGHMLGNRVVEERGQTESQETWFLCCDQTLIWHDLEHPQTRFLCNQSLLSDCACSIGQNLKDIDFSYASKNYDDTNNTSLFGTNQGYMQKSVHRIMSIISFISIHCKYNAITQSSFQCCFMYRRNITLTKHPLFSPFQVQWTPAKEN